MGIVRCLVLVCTALGAGLPASAAPVTVRSGEHATFTRLVFDHTDNDWTIERTAPDSVIIAFDGPPLDLDLSDVFKRIPRARLSALATDGADLRLDLACACKVDMNRLTSGHVVIDILDETVAWQPPQPTARETDTILPLRLPAPDLWLPLLAGLIARGPGPLRPLEVTPEQAPEPHPAAPQVRILPVRLPQLLPDRPFDPGPVLTTPACVLEDSARAILISDPAAALADLPSLSTALLDGEERLDLTAASALARGYLAAGMGAEAMQVQRVAADASPVRRAIAAAFDGLPRPSGVALDPACGPATTLVALLDADPVEGWDRADRRALVTLMDGLPPARWRDVEPRLRAALTRLGAESLLVGLHPPAMPDGPDMSGIPPTVVASGTDSAAVEAAISLLAEANARGTPAPESHLVNAMALRRSLPNGDLGRALDATLATALVLARHPSEATALASEGAVPAAQVLSDALALLPGPAAAEFAVRLKPLLSDDMPNLRRIDDLLTELGLLASSNLAGEKPEAAGPAITEVRDAPDPWLARDLAALAGAPEKDWTGRNRLASAIVIRNGDRLPATDLARADRVLQDSRALSELIADLLADPAS